MEFIAKGKPIEENDTIWFCVTCSGCQERCPRGILLVDIRLKARRNVIRISTCGIPRGHLS